MECYGGYVANLVIFIYVPFQSPCSAPVNQQPVTTCMRRLFFGGKSSEAYGGMGPLALGNWGYFFPVQEWGPPYTCHLTVNMIWFVGRIVFFSRWCLPNKFNSPSWMSLFVSTCYNQATLPFTYFFSLERRISYIHTDLDSENLTPGRQRKAMMGRCISFWDSGDIRPFPGDGQRVSPQRSEGDNAPPPRYLSDCKRCNSSRWRRCSFDFFWSLQGCWFDGCVFLFGQWKPMQSCPKFPISRTKTCHFGSVVRQFFLQKNRSSGSPNTKLCLLVGSGILEKWIIPKP